MPRGRQTQERPADTVEAPVNTTEKRYIADLKSAKYALSRPIGITVRAVDDEYIVAFTEAELSRSGKTLDEAIDWLQSSVVTLFDSLKARAQTLGPLPGRQLLTFLLSEFRRARRARERTAPSVLAEAR